MTSSYEGQYVIRPIPAVESSGGGLDREVQALVKRIEEEDPSHPPFIHRPDGLGFSTLAAAERIVDNPRINREGRGELLLDLDPDWGQINLR